MQEVGETKGEKHVFDAMKLKGTYLVHEDGEVFVLLTLPSSKIVSPTTQLPVTLGFSNPGDVIKQLEIKAALTKLDLKDFCGLEGSVTLMVSDLQTGEGPARRWHTARLVRVIAKSPFRMVKC